MAIPMDVRVAKPLQLGTMPQTRTIQSGAESDSMASGNRLATLNGNDLSQQLEESYPNEKVDAQHVDIENEHEPDMPIPVPEGPMPSHAPSTPGRVVSENNHEPT